MKKTTGIFLLVIVVGFAFWGCNPAADGRNVAPSQSQALTGKVVYYGNQIYYFPYTGVYFGNVLSAFLSQHTDLKVVAVSADGNGSYGRDRGYFVIFEKK